MKKRIAFIFGGKSVEHEVSIVSVHQVIKSVDIKKYDYYLIYLSKDNHFYISDEFYNQDNFKNEIINKTEVIFYKTKNNQTRLKGLYKKIPKVYCDDIDVIFGVVHGKNIEDGSLAGYFKIIDVPYAMCSLAGASICQDKVNTKIMLVSKGIKVIDYISFYEDDWKNGRSQTINKVETLGYPLMVKPATLGSSIGITKVTQKNELIKAIINALNYDDKVLVEKAIDNYKEYNCAFLGDKKDFRISCIEEVSSDNDLLSFNDKYLNESRRIIPAEISQELQDEIVNTTKEVALLLDLSGVVRIDYLYDIEADQLYVNEVNSIPGSLAYNLFEENNIYMHDIVDFLFERAIDASYHENSKQSQFISDILKKDYLDK